MNKRINMFFKVLNKDNLARNGRIKTSRGEVDTPFFDIEYEESAK